MVSFSVFVFRCCRAKCKLPRCLLFQAILRHAAELCVSTRCSSTRFGVGGAPTGREESGFNCPSCSCSSSRRSRLPLGVVASGLFFRGRPQLPWHRGREEASLMLPAEKEEENLSTVPRPSLLLSACCFSLWMFLFRERRASSKTYTPNQRRLSTASKLSHCLVNLPLSRVESSTSSRWKKRKHSVSLFGNPTTFLPSSLPLTSCSPPWRRHRY